MTEQGDFFVGPSDPYKIVVVLPVIRLLSTVNATRTLVFGLLVSLPSFYSLFALLAVSDVALLMLANQPCTHMYALTWPYSWSCKPRSHCSCCTTALPLSASCGSLASCPSSSHRQLMSTLIALAKPCARCSRYDGPTGAPHTQPPRCCRLTLVACMVSPADDWRGVERHYVHHRGRFGLSWPDGLLFGLHCHRASHVQQCVHWSCC